MQSRITFNSQLKIALSLNRDNHDSISLRTNLFVVITANHQGWLAKFITTWIKKRVCRVKWEGLHTNCHTWREAVRIEYNIWRHSRLCERHVLNRPLLAKREKKKRIISTVSRLSRFKLFFLFFLQQIQETFLRTKRGEFTKKMVCSLAAPSQYRLIFTTKHKFWRTLLIEGTSLVWLIQHLKLPKGFH